MHKEYHLGQSPIPDGYRVYEERVSVAGTQYRRGAAAAFATGKDRALQLEQEPRNPHDKNAIRVMGEWRGWFFRKRALIGYLPREISAHLIDAAVISQVRPRLLKTYVGHDSYVEVVIQIVGPKALYLSYHPAIETSSSRAKTKLASSNTDSTERELLDAIAEEERKAASQRWGVSARVYIDLAKHYRRLKRRDAEIAILERFAAQPVIAFGRSQEEAFERLEKLKKS